MQEIKFIINAEGKVKTEVNGIKGGKCQELTRAVEEALGKVKNSEKTGEYYLKENPARLRIRGR